MPAFPSRTLLRLLAISFAFGGCAPNLLAARAAPERALPRIVIDPGPPKPGLGRVGIDVVDGPTMVSLSNDGFGAVKRILGVPGGREVIYGGESFLCETPCVVDLPYGSYKLLFRRGTDTDEGSIVVGPRPSVYRRALGYHRPPSPGAVVGGASMIGLAAMGMMMGPVMAAVPDGPSKAGIAITAVGGALAAVGAGLLHGYRDEIQPGAAIQWEPPDGVIYTCAP
jgi:hypothetical protein